MKKKKKILQDIIIVQMYEVIKIQMHFQSILDILFFQNVYMCAFWKNL